MSLITGNLLVGDIWSTGAFSFDSPLKDLLDAGDYTLEQLLAEDELLQELRGVHPKLIEFFSTEASVTRLVHYIIDPKPIAMGMGGKTGVAAGTTNGSSSLVTPKDPSTWLEQKGKNNDPEMLYIRFPFMACEIICCDIDGIINLLVDGKVKDSERINNKEDTDETTATTSILDLFFSLLTNTPVGALDDYRAGYFEKVLRVLLKKRAQAMTTYLRDNKETLIPALLQHLYSHSIMQIAQRLLMPHRPTPKKTVEEPEEKKNGHDDELGHAQNDEAPLLLTPPEDDEEDAPEVNNPEIKCEWSSSEQALDILLDSLIGPMPTPSDDEDDTTTSESITIPTESEQEQQLDVSLNASEVLITIVQNSMLSSAQMLRLTSTPVLERLIYAATTCRPDPDVFSYHESLLTCAMSVLESLILQLGGYGAVGTMSLVEETATRQQEDSDPQLLPDKQDTDHLIADLSSLVELLPLLLDNLSELLTHPSNVDWKTPTQFSKVEPQAMLGSSRLRIVRVLEALVLLGDERVDEKLVQSDCLEICLELFWEFQWCSMLHQSVANLLVHVFEGRNARVDMQEYFLIRCNILVRLMDSFNESMHDNQRTPPSSSPDVVENMNDVTVNDIARPVDNDKESGDSDPLPISEDDVDAALEKQEADAEAGQDQSLPVDANLDQVSTEAVQFESRGGSTVGMSAPPAQSFRYGYMGHVIIICQALVHACTQTEPEDDDQTRQSEEGTRSVRSTDRLAGIKRSTSSIASRNANDSVCSVSKGDEESMEKEPLFLAEMVRYHPLSDRWEEFVNTTLASETAIQSTPLGGYNAAGGDPLHGHRPGLADEGDALGLDGQPSMPSRGLLGELDLDDNDLDIAANMMALGMGRGRVGSDDDDDFSGSGDSNRSYNSGETNHSGGYLFDDPLGKDNTGLGIELGKLTKMKSDLLKAHESKKEGTADDDGSSASSDRSSSSEEENQDTGEDAPVMDLFAGNFSYDQPGDSSGPIEPMGDFDFANFDDAFAETNASGDEDEFGAFVDAASSDEAIELEGVFQPGDDIKLLEADDVFEANGELQQPSPSDHYADPVENTSPEPPDLVTAPSDELKDDGKAHLGTFESPLADQGAEVSQTS